MTTSQPTGEARANTAEVEVPNELELAKAAFTKKFTGELNKYLGSENRGGKELFQKMADYIGSTMIDRLLKKFPKMTEKEKTEFFESLPALKEVPLSTHGQALDKGKRSDLIVRLPNNLAIENKYLMQVLAEYTRAQILARSINIEYSGSLTSSDKISIDTYLDAYKGLLELDQLHKESGAVKLTTETVGGKVVNVNLSRTAQAPAAEIYQQDPELFADMMIAFGVRQGAGFKGKTFNESWSSMPGNGFDQYGTPIKLTAEGIPYRPEHRDADVKLAKENVTKFDTFGTLVKTYGELVIEGQNAEYKNDLLTREVGELRRADKQLRAEVDSLRSAATIASSETATTAEKAAATETKAKAEIVKHNKQVKEQIAEVAARKVGFMSKDTRIEEMLALMNTLK